jgi:hypothetical protein
VEETKRYKEGKDRRRRILRRKWRRRRSLRRARAEEHGSLRRESPTRRRLWERVGEKGKGRGEEEEGVDERKDATSGRLCGVERRAPWARLAGLGLGFGSGGMSIRMNGGGWMGAEWRGEEEEEEAASSPMGVCWGFARR